jgi:hypothetical protein
MEGVRFAAYFTSFFFIVVTTIVVLLRYGIRIYIKGFRTDDWTMAIGQVSVH